MQSAVRVWRKQQKDRNLLGTKGRILSWTDIFVSPPKFEAETPYTIVLVELEDKKRVYGQLVDFTDEDKKIGKEVTAVLRRNGEVGKEEIVEYGVKFRPSK